MLQEWRSATYWEPLSMRATMAQQVTHGQAVTAVPPLLPRPPTPEQELPGVKKNASSPRPPSTGHESPDHTPPAGPVRGLLAGSSTQTRRSLRPTTMAVHADTGASFLS